LAGPSIEINMFKVGCRILLGLISVYVKVGSHCL
jgi:hypothetical protein